MKIYTVTWVFGVQVGAQATPDQAEASDFIKEMAGQGATCFMSEQEYEGQVQIDNKPIILLDLNFTLVANSNETFDFKRGPAIARETYRNWLVELLAGHTVILITARTNNYAKATLEHIAQLCGGWQPDESYFKPYENRFMPAPDWKEAVLINHVFPAHGTNPLRFLALESNANTRAMYADYNLMATAVPKRPWLKLPPVVRQSGGRKAALLNPR